MSDPVPRYKLILSIMWPAPCVAIFLFSVGGDAVSTEILEPIRPSGDEVGLILVPGALVKGDQYKKVAQAIQEASDLRIWVALTKDYMFDFVLPFELSGAIDGAIKALKQSGLKSNNYVGIGHSLGGLLFRNYAKTSKELKALVLMASNLERDTKLRDFPLPVLTVAAELDGQTRITRMLEEYIKLMQDVSLSRNAMYRNPVVVVEGANHAQFGSGRMPIRVQTMNPMPDVSESDAHSSIAAYVSSFLAVHCSNDAALVMTAMAELESYYIDSGKIFQPLLYVKALTEVDASGYLPWAGVAQKHLAGYLADQVEVNNKVFKSFAFSYFKTDISKIENRVIVDTSAYVDLEWAPFDRPTVPQSPKEIGLKMKSKSAIKTAMGFAESDNEQGPDCSVLNEIAFNVALDKSTTAARTRYHKQGRPITFELDIVRSNEVMWESTFSRSWQDETGLHVQAVALTSPVTNKYFPGNVYCKVMSPYRALEWIILDSLKPY